MSGCSPDFDGVLSAIVGDPAAATPVSGATDLLGALAQRFDRVWVISGRPVSFLEPFVPAAVSISGLYGLESSVAGVRSEHPAAHEWRRVVEEVADLAVEAIDAAGVERKGLALTLHYRGRAGSAEKVESFAGEQADRTGLVVHAARQSVELRPPIEADKGTVLEAAAEGLAAACFIGDDRGDLTAFDALDRLAARGMTTVRVGVASAEAPPELLDRADLVVAGPLAVVELLGSLLV